MPLRLPRLYVIADAEVLAARGVGLAEFAAELQAGGAMLVQYRDKRGGPQEVLRAMAGLRERLPEATLIVNDRADLAVLAECDGVHVGQEDLAAEDARRVVGAGRMVGVSTHNDEQVRAAEASVADYVAIGPVFGTVTKENPDPVVGLDGVRRARALTTKPLVAIGGITRANARSVIETGADAVAVISGMFSPGETVAQVVRDFLDVLG